MTDDDAIADRLLLPPCRPTMRAGVPLYAFYSLWIGWGLGLLMFGALITGTGVGVMTWLALKAITAKDFNAISVAWTYCRTKLVAPRSLIWIAGVTLDPLYYRRPE